MNRIFRLRWQTLGPSLVAIAVVVLVSGWVGTTRLMQHFRELERAQVARARAQADYTFGRSLDNLRTHGLDWSQWDDAVSWIAGNAPDFPTSNINAGSLSTLNLDGLVYRDGALRRLAGIGTPDGEPLIRSEDSLARRVAATGSGWTGIVRAGDSLFLCTVQPVRPSDGSGPPRGWLTMFQFADKSLDSALSLQLQFPTRLMAHGEIAEISSWKDADSGRLSWEVPVLNGSSAIMEIRLDRPMLMIGRSASNRFLLQLVVGLGVAVLLSLAILERFVLSRIARLGDAVDKIRRDGDSRSEIVDPHDDELGNLSRRIEEMVVAARASRVRLEDALDLAEAARRARMSFLQSMTHELRTPLNGVIALTEMALKAKLEPDVQEAMELSRGAALGLLETINGVLEFSRLEKGEVELVLEEIDLVDHLLDASRVVAFDAERKGVDFLFLADPSLPSRVMTDAARLRRIFVNLAGNAVKYTQAGKVVVEITPDRSIDGIRIAIRDTGIGIATDRLSAVFEPFVQADEESAIRYGGTGLGLSVAQALAQALGGGIHATSTLGKGSEFWFSWQPVVCAGPSEFLQPRGGVQLDISRPELGAFLRAAFASNTDAGKGILVTDSLEKAFAIPQRSVVLCKSTDLRRARTILDDGRSEIVTYPFHVREVAAALVRCERAEATIAILASGRILRGLLVGLLEGGGYRTLSPDTPEEFFKILQYGIGQGVVVDREDPRWVESISACDLPVLGIGDPEDSPLRATLRKPVRSDELLAAVAKMLASASSKGDG